MIRQRIALKRSHWSTLERSHTYWAGHTLESVCPPCAERARLLRAAQCREGWHLDHEPIVEPGPATEDQRALITGRAEAQEARDLLASAGVGTADLEEEIGELDQQITGAGMRGTVLPARPRRHRSTRRRQDAAPLPRRPVSARTVGKTYTAPDGTTFRPSLFLTLTCPSYGRVREDGTPADPDGYDYTANQGEDPFDGPPLLIPVPRDHGVLFCWPDGRPPHPDTITRRFKKLAAAAGLPDIDLHGVRHSYATAGQGRGVASDQHCPEGVNVPGLRWAVGVLPGSRAWRAAKWPVTCDVIMRLHRAGRPRRSVAALVSPFTEVKSG